MSGRFQVALSDTPCALHATDSPLSKPIGTKLSFSFSQTRKGANWSDMSDWKLAVFAVVVHPQFGSDLHGSPIEKSQEIIESGLKWILMWVSATSGDQDTNFMF